MTSSDTSKCASIRLDGRTATVFIEPVSWGRPYEELRRQAESGYAILSLYSHNSFSNPFHDADVARYQRRGRWTEIFNDLVRPRAKNLGETSPGQDYIPVKVITGMGLPYQREFDDWLPTRRGLILPVEDEKNGYRFFKPGRLIPEKIIPVEDREMAKKAFSEFNLPLEELMTFVRFADAGDQMVARSFGEAKDIVVGGYRPSSRNDFTGSRPRLELIMEI